jgi:beta-N-acetylhexosaminidase
VLAVAAGVDALLIGHDLGVEAVAAVQSALVDAVAGGELPEARLREAAERVARTGAWATASGGGDVDREAGRTVARLALETEGDVELESAPLVVELRPRANIAAGEAEHSLGDVLAGRLPGTRSVVLDEAGAGSAQTDGGPAVVVVRDAHRHPWMRDAAERLAPDAIVVELGLPLWRPSGARGYAVTHGGSRVSYEVLADRLVPSGVRA